MAVVWLLLEVIMLFFYYDLPKVHASNPASDGSINSTEYSVEQRPLFAENTDYLTDSSTIDETEKQKLVTTFTSHKHSRTSSVMDNWHLASGKFRLINE